MLNKVCVENFLKKLLAVEQPALPVDEPLEAAPAACMECAPAVVQEFTSTVCTSAGCRKKRTKECATGMCFQCCYNLKTACTAHFRMRKKREEEDKFIEEGLRSGSKQKTTFYHYESKFMKCDQTVVIWCLQDFLQRKEWSGDTMAQYRREQRTQDLFRRRQGTDVQSQSSSSSNLALTAGSRGSGSSSKRGGTAAARGGGSGVNSPAPAATSTKQASSSSSSSASASASAKSASVTSPVPAAAGVKRGRGRSSSKAAAAAAAATSASTSEKLRPMTRAEKRFQKVKEMWEKKYKLKA